MEMDEIAREDDAKSEATQNVICRTMRQAAADTVALSPEVATYPVLIEAARTAYALLNWIAEQDGGDEVIDASESTWLTPQAYALVVGNQLPHLGMNPTNKVFWLNVGHELGGGNIEDWRNVGAFMAKVENF